MSKSSKVQSEVNTISINAVEPMTFEVLFAAIPTNEHRTFGQADFDTIKALSFPNSVEEMKTFLTGKTDKQIFALAMLAGRAECIRVSKLYLAEGVHVEKKSASQSFLGVGGDTPKWAGKLTYGLLSVMKHS